MIIAPLSRNLLTSATVLSDARTFERGLPAANLFTADPLERARWRGLFIVDSMSNKSDFTDAGGAHTATLASGTYYSAAEYAAEIARAHGAVGAVAWVAYQEQGAGYRRFVVRPVSGTASLEIASGANTATNALKLLAGFRNQDRSAAASHTGDYPAVHGPFVRCQVDLGAATYTATLGAVVAPLASPGAVFAVLTGEALASGEIDSPTTRVLAGADDEILTVTGTAIAHRYVELRCYDPRGWTVERPEVGLWWHGNGYDTDDAALAGRLEWEALSYRGTVATRYLSGETLTGHLSVVEIEPRETVEVQFGTAPGVGPDQVPGLRQLAADIGVNGTAIVSAMPSLEPSREAMYCRLLAMPEWTRIPIQSALSRWSTSFRFERMPVR